MGVLVRVCRAAGITVGRHVASIGEAPTRSGIITIMEKKKGFVADGAFMDWKTDQLPLIRGACQK